MPIDLPVVILTTQAEVRPAPVSSLGAALSALRRWESADGVHAIAPRETPIEQGVAPDATRLARLAHIEETLRDARSTLDLADRAAVDALRASLAEIYGEARAHPDDPEAFALVAETLRTMARVESLAGSPDDAAALRRRASTFDDGRLLGLSEGPETATEPTAPLTWSLSLEGVQGQVLVHIDGRPRIISDGKQPVVVTLAAGEHQLRIVRAGTGGLDGSVLRASFFVVTEASDRAPRLRVGEPALPCTTRDLEPALSATSKDPRAGFVVSCPRWARVVRLRDDAVEVRLCGSNACGGKVEWTSTATITGNGTGKPAGNGEEGTSVWRSPWTYVAIGAAAAAITGVAAWRLGAFDRDDAPAPTWRWEGTGIR